MRIVYGVLLLLALAGPAVAQEDLRVRFGTRSLEAAQKLGEALKLMNARKNKEALAAIQAALKLDPKCQMAYYWRGVVQGDLGDIDEAIASYKTSLSSEISKSRNIAATTANNLALVLIKLDKAEEAKQWFTRAIMEDYEGRFKQRGKAYRNLAILLRSKNQHLAALISLALAARDKAPNISPKMISDFLDKADENEVGVLMSFGKPVPKVSPRSHKTSLTEASLADEPKEKIDQLWPDPKGKYIIAVPHGAEHYYAISTDGTLKAARVSAPGKIVATSLAGGSLYVLTGDRIEQLDPVSGKKLATTKIVGAPPKIASLAVLPARNIACVCIDETVTVVALKTGRMFKSDTPGQVVVAHPDQSSVYSYVKPKRGGNASYLVINGRMVPLRRRFDWAQTTLYQSAVSPGSLLPMAVRENAASNAGRMSVSPDGKWVAVVGGGGYRPQKAKAGEAGYGVAVFAADNLGHRQGYFQTEAYPNGVCFNPVTGQLTTVREDDAHVYHLSDPKKAEILKPKGKFSGASTFSGNGKYLVLAKAAGGLAVWENGLSDEEKKLAGTWWKALDVPATPVTKPAPGPTFKPVPALAKFTLKDLTRAEVSALFAESLKTGRTELPGRWQDYGPYGGPARAATQEASELAGSKDVGIGIYKVRQHLKKHKGLAPLNFFLAELLRRGDQGEKAQGHYLEVVQADQGRTDLTPLALNGLALLLADKPMQALYCLGTSLSLDRVRPATVNQAKALLAKNKFDAEVKKLDALGTEAPIKTGLPELPKPPAPGKKLAAEELFKRATQSVVMVKTSDGSGSGVCVGKTNLIVTNQHVVGDADSVDVIPFKMEDKTVSRLPKVRAKVIYRDAKEDIAVLSLEKVPATLQAMPVVATDAGPGTKVFAVGHPGLGDKVLDLSISEGLVSSSKREIAGTVMLQHSASVNRGNSGGPLLDEYGRVVGIVTLKARLEGVSFAVRIETLRKIFSGSEK
jgi:S1-C subfamily serine protease/Tfp pilus assembly protein PilF